MKEGENVTGLEADEVRRGTVRVEQTIDKGTHVKGATIGKIE